MAISAEDRLAILELAARYNQAFDYGDVDAWVKTFTSDGVFADSGGFSVQGTDELRTFAGKAAQGDVAIRHWNSSHVIEGNGDTATHSCYLMLIIMEEVPTIFGVGRYDDKLKKVNGEWRFVRRLLTRECER